MSVSIEHWRAVIGRFSGGRSGTSLSSKVRPGHRYQASTGCIAIGGLLKVLILSPLLLSGWSHLSGNNYSSSSSSSSSLPCTTAAPWPAGPSSAWLVAYPSPWLYVPPSWGWLLVSPPPWPPPSTSSWPTWSPVYMACFMIVKKSRNKLARATNGNRQNRGIKLEAIWQFLIIKWAVKL